MKWYQLLMLIISIAYCIDVVYRIIIGEPHFESTVLALLFGLIGTIDNKERAA